MKFSIITVCYNSESTIAQTIESVRMQKYAHFEHIIIDGASTDQTINIIQDLTHDNLYFISEPDHGLYDAINKGIKKSTGDIIGVLNSDDIYPTSDVLETIHESFDDEVDVIFGNAAFFKGDNSNNLKRIINIRNFKPWFLRFGWMPPHTATFLRRHVVSNVGIYDTSYISAADYDYFFRVFYISKYKFKKIQKILVKMRIGGISTRGFSSYVLTGKEINRCIKSHGYYTNFLLISMRLPIKYVFEKLIGKY